MDMATSTILQMRSKGSLTVPIELRRKYGLDEGDLLTLIDLGDGSFLLTPRVSQVDRLADRVAEAVQKEGLSLDDVLQVLNEERERYYQDNYAPGNAVPR
jgi:bifunctional DNA-binding transcriptional regulator/antitoxin component of YhaV-PrlF toxin-antitoxin module